jgi:hypothetical protein
VIDGQNRMCDEQKRLCAGHIPELATFGARDGPFYIDAAMTLPLPPGDGRMTGGCPSTPP